LKYLANGTALLSFSVAVDQSYSAEEQRAAPEPLRVRVTVWADLAEALADQLHKGSAVYIEGKLTLSQWTARHAGARAGLNVSARRCEVHGLIGKAAPQPAAGSAGRSEPAIALGERPAWRR